MKLIIVLKPEDAAGLGGDILEEKGMVRSKGIAGLFSITMPTFDPHTMDFGGASRLSPDSNVMHYVEALTDAGIRPVKVSIRTDSNSGLTPLSSSATASGKSAPGRRWANTMGKIHCASLCVEDVVRLLRRK
jgi:hypothetical protein